MRTHSSARLLPAMRSRLIRRHDQFFKRLLEQPGAAGALLRERLPPEIAKLLGPD